MSVGGRSDAASGSVGRERCARLGLQGGRVEPSEAAPRVPIFVHCVSFQETRPNQAPDGCRHDPGRSLSLKSPTGPVNGASPLSGGGLQPPPAPRVGLSKGQTPPLGLPTTAGTRMALGDKDAVHIGSPPDRRSFARRSANARPPGRQTDTDGGMIIAPGTRSAVRIVNRSSTSTLTCGRFRSASAPRPLRAIRRSSYSRPLQAIYT
jgi:hypothetical protein